MAIIAPSGKQSPVTSDQYGEYTRHEKMEFFLFNIEYTSRHVEKKFAFAICCKIQVKKLYIFVILAHFRIFQGDKTNKENMHLKVNGNCSEKSDAIDTMQEQIKFITKLFNLANI